MRNRVFIGTAVLILLLAAIIRIKWMDRWEQPSACACKSVFQADSSIAMPAARAMVGNAYYDYTLLMARKRCLATFASELPAAAWQDTLNSNGKAGYDFFSAKCP